MDRLVSILIPTYNSSRYIERALLSALGQTYSNIEIIAHDNASTDNTWDIVASHAERDSRIKIYRNEHNLGPLRNWQNGLAQCTGAYVKILWSDDWMDTRCVEECVQRLEEDPDVGLVFTSVVIHASNHDWPQNHHPDHPVFDVETYLTKTMLRDNMPNSPGCALVRRADAKFDVIAGASENLKDVGYRLGAGPDCLFMLIAALNYKRVAHIPKFYSHFQNRGDSHTGANWPLVLRAYKETFRLFLKEIAAPKYPRLKKRVLLTRPYKILRDRVSQFLTRLS